MGVPPRTGTNSHWVADPERHRTLVPVPPHATVSRSRNWRRPIQVTEPGLAHFPTPLSCGSSRSRSWSRPGCWGDDPQTSAQPPPPRVWPRGDSRGRRARGAPAPLSLPLPPPPVAPPRPALLRVGSRPSPGGVPLCACAAGGKRVSSSATTATCLRSAPTRPAPALSSTHLANPLPPPDIASAFALDRSPRISELFSVEWVWLPTW